MSNLVAIILCFIGSVSLHYCRGFSDGIPKYVVNLDMTPKNRWDHIVVNYDSSIVVKGMDEALAALKLNGTLKPIALKIAADLDKYFPQPYADEIRGISEKWNVSLGYIVIANIFYDLSAYTGSPAAQKACTSIVTNDKNGNIIHGRNLDYDFGDFLKQVAARIEYQRNGVTLFYSVSFVGQVGFVTGFKPGAFSISLNERDTGEWWNNLISAAEGAWPTFVYIRQALEDVKSYEEALQFFAKMKVIAPAYLIVGGLETNEGAVVIGNREGAIIERMNNTNQHGWFVVETNYDPWNPPPKEDDRRDPAIKVMNNIGENKMDYINLFKVLSTPPMFNEQTMYTTIMSAGNTSLFHTVMRKKTKIEIFQEL